MNTPEQQLSDSLLAACKAVGIDQPKYIAQDFSGKIYHYKDKPVPHNSVWWDNSYDCIRIYHPPYADDWKDSLMEWVEPQGEPLANVLARHPDHVADVSKMIADEARKLGYRKMIAEYAGRRTEAQVYERAWQDALAWKGGSDD